MVNVERAIDGVQKIEQEDSIKYESFVENEDIIKGCFHNENSLFLRKDPHKIKCQYVGVILKTYLSS